MIDPCDLNLGLRSSLISLFRLLTFPVEYFCLLVVRQFVDGKLKVSSGEFEVDLFSCNRERCLVRFKGRTFSDKACTVSSCFVGIGVPRVSGQVRVEVGQVVDDVGVQVVLRVEGVFSLIMVNKVESWYS